MDKRYAAFTLLEILVVTLPLGLVLFLVLPATDDADFGYLLWAIFSTAAAGIGPLLLRTFRPAISRGVSGVNDPRLDRLARILFFALFALLLPLWFAVFDPPAGASPWVRAAAVPASLIVLGLLVRFLSLPGYWRMYRDRAAEAGWDFIGSDLDLRTRPEYYDQDVAWILAAIRKRLTSASLVSLCPGGMPDKSQVASDPAAE